MDDGNRVCASGEPMTRIYEILLERFNGFQVQGFVEMRLTLQICDPLLYFAT